MLITASADRVLFRADVILRAVMLLLNVDARLRGMNWLESGRSASRMRGNPRREALFFNQLEVAWSALGEQQTALDFYEQALPLVRAVGDRGGEAVTMFNMSFLVNDNQRAIELVQTAHDLWVAISSPYAQQHAAPRLAKLRGGEQLQNKPPNLCVS